MPKKKELEFKDITLPIKVDASKINLFNTCPFKFYLRYYSNLEVKDTTWPNTVFGTSVHKVVERAFKSFNNGVDLQIVLDSIDFEKDFLYYKEKAGKSFRESRYYDEEEFIKLGKKYSAAIVKFIYNHFDTAKVYIIKPEIKFTCKFSFVDDIECVGKLDSLIQYNSGLYDIYDLKTTSKNEQYLFVNWDEAIQDLMYEYLTFMDYKQFANSFNFLVINKDEKMIFLKSKIITSPETEEELREYFSPLTISIKRMKKFLLLPYEEKIKFKLHAYNTCRYCFGQKTCEG